MTTTTKTTKTVTIERKGHFDDDAFFKDSWADWDTAMKDAIDRWEKKTSGTRTTKTTNISSLPTREAQSIYRQIRSSNVTADESQAIACTEENDRFKMVVDVKDFNPENISVKAVDETIVVEGYIEKKDGNSASSQSYVRKFLMPPGVDMSKITSALSRDGVLTLSVPKKVPTKIYGPRSSSDNPNHRTTTTVTTRGPTGKQVKVYRNYAAGKPTYTDDGPFNPTGGGYSTTHTYVSPDGTRHYTETFNNSSLPNRKPHTVWTSTGNNDRWTTLDTVSDQSRKEMEDMMRAHSINNDRNLSYTRPITVRREPYGVGTYRDVSGNDNSLTQREERRWNDEPSPGLNRQNKSYYESNEIKDSMGNVIGHRRMEELESNAEGEKEERLPDGSKRKVFTTCYETQNYKSTSRPTKAL